MTADASPDDPLAAFTVPNDWTDAARDLFREVLTERPDLAGADLGALDHACALTSAAERLDAVAASTDYVATGSTGQTIVHPAVTEARLARTAAAQILARLTAPTKGGAQTNSERGRAAARARWSR